MLPYWICRDYSQGWVGFVVQHRDRQLIPAQIMELCSYFYRTVAYSFLFNKNLISCTHMQQLGKMFKTAATDIHIPFISLSSCHCDAISI